jgi:hypothetical protein
VFASDSRPARLSRRSSGSAGARLRARGASAGARGARSSMGSR